MRRAAIASQQPRRQFSRRFELLDPAHGARDADFETLCRRIARQPARDDGLHHSFAKIVGKRHARRLPSAAGIMNQIAADSGIPIRFKSFGARSKQKSRILLDAEAISYNYRYDT